MTPDEELSKMRTKQKRKNRDLWWFVAGFVVGLAFVGLTYLGSI